MYDIVRRMEIGLCKMEQVHLGEMRVGSKIHCFQEWCMVLSEEWLGFCNISRYKVSK
ncbi:unnamed protein product [Spirodela intermedia]|uniref:Uncharacterized protein n=1 Tax=Spirodela intermedia TaxID=51605 RepID=A0A7I8LNE8_SPIIN|nr:unnamed protein product [Spirodela intermedia]